MSDTSYTISCFKYGIAISVLELLEKIHTQLDFLKARDDKFITLGEFVQYACDNNKILITFDQDTEHLTVSFS